MVIAVVKHAYGMLQKIFTSEHLHGHTYKPMQRNNTVSPALTGFRHVSHWLHIFESSHTYLTKNACGTKSLVSTPFYSFLRDDLLSPRRNRALLFFPEALVVVRVSKKQSQNPLVPTGSLISLFIRQCCQCKLTQPLSTWPPHVNSMREAARIKDWVMDDVSKCFVGHKWTVSYTHTYVHTCP